jgi:plasmid stabilization system protein ParE
MSWPVAYLPEARDDIDEAYGGYEVRSAGLGDRFLETLREHVDRIRENPALYGEFYQGVRAALLRRFPYVVYYRAEAERVVIIAVQHGRRSFRAWRGRV